MNCGPKNGQNRYTRPVLTQMASSAGITNSVIRKADIQELCRLLNLPAIAGGPVAAPIPIPVAPMLCGPTHGKNRYTKPVLAQMALRAGIENSVIRKASLKDLCDLLNLSGDPAVIRPGSPGVPASPRSPHQATHPLQCGPKHGPNRYKRPVLEKMARDAGIANSVIRKADLLELCRLLKLSALTRESPRLSPPRLSPTRPSSPRPSPRRPSSPRLSPTRPSSPHMSPPGTLPVGPSIGHHTIVPACISRSKLHPKDYQLKVINHLRRNRGILVVHGLGSGKTLTSVIASQCYLDNNPRKNVYVITPKTLIDNWKNELLSGYKHVQNLNRYHFYTIPGFLNVKIDCKNSMLIIDEAHTLRTEISKKKGKRAEAVIDCAKICDKVILLTGTPYVNDVNDLNNLMSIIDGKTPENKKIFKNSYNDDDFFRRTFRNKISLYNPPNEILDAHYPRVEKHEIVLPMTKKILKQYIDIESKLPNPNDEVKSMAFFSGVRRASNKADSKKPSNTLIKLFKISQKIEWLNNFIDSNMIGKKNENNKMVIFSSFIDSGMNLVEKLLELKDQKYSHINGQSKKDDRAIVVKNYNKNKSRYLLISKAAGEGIDLKNTTFMIILDPAWNSVTTSQAMGRVARFNSHAGNLNKKVDIYMLYLLKPKEKLTHVEDLETFMGEYSLEHSTLENPEPIPSIDLYLRAMSISKQNNIERFIRRVTPLTIENS